ncbi:TPA: AAA family ATPase [Vibrio parahaemolyticus]|nr:AAA family ATPase [Vibrio parahaemolyticus]
MSNQTYSCFSKGSEWRRWDLHLHTSSSYDAYKGHDADEKLIESLRNNSISAVAITDHFLIDADKIQTLRALAPEITFFPGVELRTDKGAANVHVILIFSETADLKKLEERFNVVMLDDKAKSSDDDRTIIWDFNDIVEFAKKNDGLISIHAGKKSNGIDKEITNALPHNMAIKQDYAENVDIFEIGQVGDIETYRKYVFPQIGIKPLVICSDNHVPKDYRVKEFLWIKGAPTFEGLKQVIYEPEERIRIQENKPDSKPQYQVIDSLEMGSSNLWSGKIHFNENLNVIIGGRSTGKSSLLSIIAMKLDNQNVESSKNYKFIKEGLSSVTINWMDGEQGASREIEFYPQSYMNTLAFDDVKRNDLIEGIVSKKDQEGELTKYEEFLSVQETTQTKLVSDLFTLNTDIKTKKAKILELGDKVGIEHEIQLLTEQLEQHNSQLTDDVKEQYEEVSKQHSELKEKNREIQPHIAEVIRAKSLKLFNELDLTDKLSHPVFGDDLLIKLNEMQEAFTKEWQDAVEEHEAILMDELSKIIKEKEAVEESEVYKKSQEYLQNNSALKEIKEKVEQEKDKLTKIQGEEKGLETLEKSLETTIKDLCDSHLEYREHAISLSQKLRFDQSDLKVTVICCFDSEKIEEILSEQLNKTKSKDVISTFCEYYNVEPEKTVRDLIQSALNDQLHFKGIHTNKTLLNQVLCSNPYRKDYELTYQNDSFDSMSQGKQAFVILKLLLEFNDKTCPVLIDQPEDSLDNRAIYNELVEYLKQKKKERQIILVTHNPNVVVSADAEQVIVANQHDPKAKNNLGRKFEYVAGGIEHSMPKDPNVDEILYSQGIREHICEILEGGEDAFKKREQKYQLSN